MPWSTRPEEFKTNEIVSDSMLAVLENTQAIGVDPEKSTSCLGPKLEFDPVKEKFVNNPEADKLLTRPYREPFVVTEKV